MRMAEWSGVYCPCTGRNIPLPTDLQILLFKHAGIPDSSFQELLSLLLGRNPKCLGLVPSCVRLTIRQIRFVTA